MRKKRPYWPFSRRAERNWRKKRNTCPALPHLPGARAHTDPRYGLRRGELLSLTWENLDLEAGTLTLKGIERRESGDNQGGTKSSQSREIPLSGRVIDALKRWRRQTKSKTGPVFADATPDALKGQWRRLTKEAGSAICAGTICATFCARRSPGRSHRRLERTHGSCGHPDHATLPACHLDRQAGMDRPDGGGLDR